jgi:hypothetical protein
LVKKRVGSVGINDADGRTSWSLSLKKDVKSCLSWWLFKATPALRISEAARLTRPARIAVATGAHSARAEFENVGRRGDRSIGQVACGRPSPEGANGDETPSDEAGHEPPETIHHH